MNRGPLFIGIAVVVIALGAMFYTLLTAHDPGSGGGKPQRQAEVGGSPAQDSVLAHAPAGPVIPALLTPGPAPPPPPIAVAPAVAPLPPAPASNGTAVEIEARKAAWQAYFQARQKTLDDHGAALKAALVSDTPAVGSNGWSGAPGGSAAIGGAETAFGGAAAGGGLGQPAEVAGGGLSGNELTGNAATGTGLAGNGLAGTAARQGGTRADLFEQAGSSPAADYLPNLPTDPLSRYELKAGDALSGVMLSGLTSDSHGIVKALVTKHAFDHATGGHILIPQGSQLVGVYQTGGATGQERVEVGWERVIFPAPCDQSLDLGIMPGADASGYSGFRDITDDHFWQIAKNLLLASVFSAGIQLSQPQSSSFNGGYSSQQIIAGSLGQQLGEFGMEMARRGIDIPPTQKIRNGYPFIIMVTRDIAFSHPWQPGLAGHPEGCGPAMQVANAR